jgi:prepilin-type processing-associated H-X9-DG protein
LVVIAIIAILAAILFPVFARARENARRASCQSNLKQLALGTLQYLQDYDERYPGFIMFLGPGSDGLMTYTLWPEAIYPYVKSTQVFVCPSESNRKARTGSVHFMDSPPWSKANPIHYIINKNVAGNGRNDASRREAVAAAQITTPADVFLLWDINPAAGSNTDNNAFVSGYDAPADGSNAWRTTGGRHFDGDNYAFCDGHVKWLKQSSVFWGSSPDVRFTVH